jgi:hypothetical protein
VELLVALALVIFIMSILSEAFVAATTSFLALKAIGDLDANLRTVATVLRNDLATYHFDGPNPKLSQIDTRTTAAQLGFFRIYQGSPPTAPTAAAPYPLYADEGVDADGIHSYRATNHMLHFSVNYGGIPTNFIADPNRLPGFLSAVVPQNTPPLNPVANWSPAPYLDPNGATLYSQWAEVAWFLRSSGTNANGAPLFDLYRRQALLVPNPLALPNLTNLNGTTAGQTVSSTMLANYPEVSCIADPTAGRSGLIYFNANTPPHFDISAPPMRFGMTPPGTPIANAGVLTATDPVIGPAYPKFSDTAGAQSTLWGRDLVLTNVLSFDVKVSLGNSYPDQYGTAAGFMDLYDPTILPLAAGRNPYYTAAGPMVFDTWCNQTSTGYYDYVSTWNTPGGYTCLPLPLPSIQAIQIVIRVWDPRTETTRQMTIVQDM